MKLQNSIKRIINKLRYFIYSFRMTMNALFFRFNPKSYPHSFISQYNSSLSDEICNKPVDSIIYIFWTGTNEMSENREKNIKSIERNCDITVKLITPYNLEEYITQDDPLPDCFQYLSHVHKSDYLRTYFMYHYGGGYSDIKLHINSWKPFFDRFNRSKNYILGYPEIGELGIAHPDDVETYSALKQNWKLLIGNCSYICRPYCKFTEEWYKETKDRVLNFNDELINHPARDPYGSNSDYPIPWTHILGDVFHPLCLKYHNKIMKDNKIKPSFSNYR